MRCSMKWLTFLMVVGALFSSRAAFAEEKVDWTGDWLFRAIPDGGKPLRTSQKAWFDEERKLVVIDGEVCTRKGPLEMLACPRNTKEYESVIVVDAMPGVVHGGLLKVGAKPGSPAKFDPYEPATGTPIDVMIVWVGEDGKRHAIRAQEWIKDVKTGQVMDRGWVFGGSQFYKSDENARTMYRADEGDFICVANFSTASIDVPVKSSQANTALNYEANTDNIPPKKTKVRLVLVPQLKAADVAQRRGEGETKN